MKCFGQRKCYAFTNDPYRPVKYCLVYKNHRCYFNFVPTPPMKFKGSGKIKKVKNGRLQKKGLQNSAMISVDAWLSEIDAKSLLKKRGKPNAPRSWNVGSTIALGLSSSGTVSRFAFDSSFKKLSYALLTIYPNEVSSFLSWHGSNFSISDEIQFRSEFTLVPHTITKKRYAFLINRIFSQLVLKAEESINWNDQKRRGGRGL